MKHNSLTKKHNSNLSRLLFLHRNTVTVLNEFFQESSEAYFEKLKNNPTLPYRAFLETWNDPKMRMIDVNRVWRSLDKRARDSKDDRYILKERNAKKVPRDEQLVIMEHYDSITHEDRKQRQRLQIEYLESKGVKLATFKTWIRDQEYDFFSTTIMPLARLLK